MALTDRFDGDAVDDQRAILHQKAVALQIGLFELLLHGVASAVCDADDAVGAGVFDQQADLQADGGGSETLGQQLIARVLAQSCNDRL